MPSVSQLDRAYSFIREQIEGGVIRPGQRLSRRNLAVEIGVSSALVQHALAQLDREGVTESRPRSGTYVRELSEKEFADLCDVRELVEPYAASLAAERVSDEQVKTLWESTRRYQHLMEGGPLRENAADAWLLRCQLIREELIFHSTILKASGNEVLEKLVSTLRLLSQVSPVMVYDNGLNKENSHEMTALEHEGIVAAIESRDPDLARERMFNHIHGARIIIHQIESKIPHPDANRAGF